MDIIQKRTKIVATLGPACGSKAILKEMILNGLDVARLNFSHGTHKQHKEHIKIIRDLNKELGVFVAILGDLQGPKLRIGEMKDGSSMLVEGKEIIITTKECKGTQFCIPCLLCLTNHYAKAR